MDLKVKGLFQEPHPERRKKHQSELKLVLKQISHIFNKTSGQFLEWDWNPADNGWWVGSHLVWGSAWMCITFAFYLNCNLTSGIQRLGRSAGSPWPFSQFDESSFSDVFLFTLINTLLRTGDQTDLTWSKNWEFLNSKRRPHCVSLINTLLIYSHSITFVSLGTFG